MYSFEEKKHSGKGKVSTALGVVSLVILIALTAVSLYFKGQAGMYLGAIGLPAVLFSFIGLIVGLMSFREDNILYFFCKLGSILNGCVFAVWAFIILIGIS